MRFFIKRNKINLKFYIARLALFLTLTFAVSPALFAENKDTVEKEKLTAREVFKNLQTSALEILPESKRLDMLDYWDADSIYKISNLMEGLSWLESVKDDYLKVRITGVSSFEIKILPEKKDEIVMTVYTVGDSRQSQDSRVEFYDSSLNKLDTNKYLEMPDLKNFFDIPKGSVTTMKEIRQMIPFPTVAFSASPDNDDLTARLTVEDYINQDDWNIIKLFVKPQITAHWKKEKFKF